jgi:hypothetical protein
LLGAVICLVDLEQADVNEPEADLGQDGPVDVERERRLAGRAQVGADHLGDLLRAGGQRVPEGGHVLGSPGGRGRAPRRERLPRRGHRLADIVDRPAGTVANTSSVAGLTTGMDDEDSGGTQEPLM